ncbi:hypothetical protein MTR_2g005940 [Medicago truncatula]|uniref:Uncharacterized protein n=1 Tax=Medicago truncatula TaxID=3880 RepID=G7INA3_MEDTR|nr:hypothetical protein MTR_2g005940 [Medicago truncatula]
MLQGTTAESDSNMSSGGSSNSAEPVSSNSNVSFPAESEEDGNSCDDGNHGSEDEAIVFNDMMGQ